MTWIVAILFAVYLAGGLHTHRRHRRARLNSRLCCSLGRDRYGSIRVPGGFRISRRP
jgi:hypothetical protein